MIDIRDVKRMIPMSYDMIHSRTVAILIWVSVPLAIFLLWSGWHWLMREIGGPT